MKMIDFVIVVNVVDIEKMIKSRKLFFIPAISAFLCIIPIIGIFLWLFILSIWYSRNQDMIHRYFKGKNYDLNEVTEDNLDKFK